MDLEQLQAEWHERERGLQETIRINTDMLRLSLVEHHRREIEKLGWWDKYELIVGTPLFVFLVWFIGKHLSDAEFLLPAVVLLIWTIVLPVLNHRQRHALQEMNYGQPIFELQRQLETLKKARIRLFLWAFLLGQIIWFIPFLIVFFKGLFGVNLYIVSKNFIVPSLIGGVVFIPVALIIAKLLSPYLRRFASLTMFIDLLAGKDLRKTKDFLEKLSKFEQEK